MKNRLITSEDKDSIIDFLIENANERLVSHLEYEDVSHLGVTKGMYEAILNEMSEQGLFKRCGYSYYFELKASIYKVKEYGGYTIERDAYFEGLKNLALQLEKTEKELYPSAIGKINSIIANCKTLAELTNSLSEIYELLCQRN